MKLATRVYRPRGKSRCSVPGCTAPYYAAGFCKKHHQWHWKRGLLPKLREISLMAKLSLYTSGDKSTDCWIWNRALTARGYGRIWVPGKGKRSAHRVAFELFVGRIPVGMEVCHRCDRPACCNPEHLFLGTHQDNMRDSATKGRAKQPKAKRGVKHPRSLLTPAEVALIRSSKIPATVLARQRGIHPQTIRRCRNRESYRDE